MATITIIANDGDGSGNVPLGTVNVDVTAVNDLPVFSGLDATPSFIEGSSAVLLDSDSTVSDVELDALNGGNGSYAGANLVILRNGGANARDKYSIQSGGNLTIDGSSISAGANVIASFDTSSPGQLAVTFQDNGTTPTTALVNEVLQAIRYSNNSNDPAVSVQLDWTFSDDNSMNIQGTGDNPGRATGSTTVSITNINDAPTLSATGSDPTYVEEAGAVDLFNTVTVSAVELGDNISSLGLTVTNVNDGASEILRFDDSDVALSNGNSVITATNALAVAVSVTGTTATVSSSGATLTSAQSQTLLDGVSYRHIGDNPTTAANRVVTITTLVDSGGTAGGGVNSAAPNLTSTVSLVSVNDPPLIGNLDGDSNVVLTGSRGKVDTGSDSIVSNADSANYNGGFLSIVDNGDNNMANGNISVDGTNVTSGSDGSLSAGETISVGGVNIGTVHATEDGQGGNDLRINLNANSSNERVQTLLRNLSWGAAAGNGAQTFTVILNDADGIANGGDQDVTANFTMTLGNPPSLGGTPADASIDEDTPSAIDLSAYIIADADGDTLTLTLTVTSGSLASSSADGVTVGSSGTASMTLHGTVANLNSFLDDATKVVYSPPANSNTAATLTVTPNDGSIDGVADTVTINIKPVDDPPEITVPGAQTSVDGTAKAIAGVIIADIDSAILTTTLTAPDGAVAVSEAGGATVTGNNSDTVSITGSVAQINAALAGLSYTPNLNSSGAQAIQLDTDDSTTSKTDRIRITVADRPSIDNFTATVTFNKGSSGEILDAGSDARVSDADSVSFNSGHLTLSITAGAVPAEDLLTVVTSGSTSLAGTTAGSNVLVSGTIVGTLGNNVAAGNDLLVNLNANATPARLSTLVQALQYQNLVSANATSGSRSISLTLSDGVNEGSASMTLTIPAPADNDPRDGQQIDGQVKNTGIMRNIIIANTGSVSGGSLAGTIVNQGMVKNVKLMAGTTINGGKVAGQITGNSNSPALLNSLVLSGSQLENVVLGPGAMLETGVALGEGICVPEANMIPELTDLTRTLDTLEWGSPDKGVISLMDLNNSPFSENCSFTGTNILSEIRSLDELQAGFIQVNQYRETGELRISADGFKATLLPAYLGKIRTGAEETQSIAVTEDGDIGILLDHGMQVIAFPAMVNMEALIAATQGIRLEILERGILSFRQPNSERKFLARPSVLAMPASSTDVLGIQVQMLSNLANVSGVSLVFADESSTFTERQELQSVPADWFELKEALLRFVEVHDAHVGLDGTIIVEATDGNSIRVKMDYWVWDANVPKDMKGIPEIMPAGDLNGDSIPDFEVIYSDGSKQWFYILP